MPSTQFRRLWLITCLMLLGGLATVVPVNCLCEADQHWGQAVHPLYPHTHYGADDHGPARSDSTPMAWGDDIDGASIVVSEHGSLLGAAFDAMLNDLSGLWLALGLLPLLRLLRTARLSLSGVTVTPLPGPPRPRPLFR